jgi:3-methyladenine DNA glycosylase/8-oxoguanine DNA glycosylase
MIGTHAGKPPGGHMTTPEDYDALLTGDPVLRSIAGTYGRPDPFAWSAGGHRTTTNFSAMLLHIASQQISTTVAVVLFERLLAAAGGEPSADDIASLGPERLHAMGFSGAKSAAMVDVAQLQLSGVVDLENLDRLDDDAVVATLTSARGVGPWTAEMFLIHQLRRPDVLPAGDLGIRHAIQRAWSLPTTPGPQQARRFGIRWSPRRSYAAALLWISLSPEPRSSVARGEQP